MGAPQVRISEVRAVDERLGQVCAAQVRPGFEWQTAVLPGMKAGRPLGETVVESAREPGAYQSRAAQIGVRETRAGQVRAGQVDVLQIGPDQVRRRQLRASLV